MKLKKILLSITLLSITAIYCSAQDEDLSDKKFTIVKGYKPIVAESNKISDAPTGDTSSAVTPKMEYTLEPKRLETNFEAGVIKAVKIKDEPLAKLYHTLIKLGIGNYTTYNGEIFYNTLRSKKGQAGLHLYHLSGDPSLSDVGKAGFSNNTAEVFGKYFLEHSTFNGNLGLDRRVIHYYGYNIGDTLISSKDTKQRYSDVNLSLGYNSNWTSDEHLDYNSNFSFHNFTDLYDVTENDLMLSGGGGKKIGDNYVGALLSFDYFKKTLAKGEILNQLSNLNRNIVSIEPYLKRNFDPVQLVIGANFTYEKNIGELSKAHLYPDVRVTVPIAEHVVYIYGNVTGGIEKVSYRTLANENPFVAPYTKPDRNQSNDIAVDGGLKGNFSSNISFDASVKYTKFSEMPLFYNDVIHPNEFNILYDDGTVVTIHGELSYRTSEKLLAGIAFNQYSYNMVAEQKAWHKPSNETKLFAKYNLQDKIIVNAILLLRGKQYARGLEYNGLIGDTVATTKSISGYADINLGAEYRYSKILSFYVNLNNLGFAKYQQWYGYPSERLNILGGLTYAF